MSVLHLLYPIIRRNRISFAEIWLTKCCVLFSSAFVCFVTTWEICLQMLNACVHSLKIAFQEVCQRIYQMTCRMKSWNSFSKAHYPRLEVCCTKTKIDACLSGEYLKSILLTSFPNAYLQSRYVMSGESTYSSDISTVKEV